MQNNETLDPTMFLSLVGDNIRLKVKDAKVNEQALSFVRSNKLELVNILKGLKSNSEDIIVNGNGEKNLESNKFNAKVNHIVEQFGVLGAQVGFYKDGSIQNIYAGFIDDSKTNTFNTELTFRLSCLTKVVVSYAALRLVDRGLFLLDEPLSNWTDLKLVDAKKLTLKHLLSHSAGFDETAVQSIQAHTVNLEDFVHNMSFYDQMLEPGQGYIYSGSSIILVAYLIERTYKKSWLEAIDELVFRPLNIELKSSNELSANSFIRSNSETGYSKKHVVSTHSVYEPAAATSIELSITDLLKLAAVPIEKGKLVSCERFLSPKLANALLKDWTPVEGNYFITGFGFGWLSFAGYGLHGFITGNQGQHTCVIINMNNKQALAAQCITQPNFEFFDALCRMFFNSPLLKVHAQPIFNVDQVVGKYESQGLIAQVYLEDGLLNVSVTYLDETGEWSNPIICRLIDSGMGDYFATPKVYPLQDSINFHDLTDTGEVTHIRITQKLCKKQY